MNAYFRRFSEELNVQDVPRQFPDMMCRIFMLIITKNVFMLIDHRQLTAVRTRWYSRRCLDD